MADNVTTQSSTLATIPASTVISTEETTTLNGSAVTAQQVQRIAAAIRTGDGTVVDLPGSTADGLLVNLGSNNDVTVASGTITAVTTITNAVAVTDNGGSLTVDGTVAATQSGAWTVDLGATDNAVLDAIAASLAGTLTVGSHAVTNAGTFAVQVTGDALTALQTLDNIVSGNEAQVDVVTQPARAATTDTITAKLATDTIQNGTTALTPKFAYLDTSSSGNQQVVAAVVSKKIRVLAWFASSNGATNIYFRSATAGQISGTKYLTQYGGAGRAFSPVGHFETTAGEALQVNNSAAVAIGVEVVYVEV